jgi:hypothetical protein
MPPQSEHLEKLTLCCDPPSRTICAWSCTCPLHEFENQPKQSVANSRGPASAHILQCIWHELLHVLCSEKHRKQLSRLLHHVLHATPSGDAHMMCISIAAHASQCMDITKRRSPWQAKGTKTYVVNTNNINAWPCHNMFATSLRCICCTSPKGRLQPWSSSYTLLVHSKCEPDCTPA